MFPIFSINCLSNFKVVLILALRGNPQAVLMCGVVLILRMVLFFWAGFYIAARTSPQFKVHFFKVNGSAA